MKMSSTKSTLLLLALLFAQEMLLAQVKKGDKAPSIVFEESYPADYRIPKGKPVLIEFWATWCTPCIAALKESNLYVDTYREKIEFLCISDSTSKHTIEFIEQNNLKQQFILNSNQHTLKNFQVRGLPTAFLIDSEGVIQWTGNGLSVNPGLLDEFLQTGKISSETTTLNVSFSSLRTDTGDFTFNLSQADPSDSSMFPIAIMGAKGDSISYSIRNYPLRGIIERLSGSPSKLIIYNLTDTHRLEKKFTLNVFAKHVDVNTINHTILEMVGTKESFILSTQLKDTVAWVFKTIDESKLRSRRTKADPTTGKNQDFQMDVKEDAEGNLQLSAINMNLSEFQSIAANHLDALLFFPDKNNTDGYDFENIDLSDWTAFQKRLLEEYGMDLVQEKTTIPFLLIEER